MPEQNTQQNLAETLAQEMKTPIEIISAQEAAIRRLALPPGWTMIEKDDHKHLATPTRKTAKVNLNTPESFIDYLTRHGDPAETTIWCIDDYKKGKVDFTGIINDNGATATAAWRDHLLHFTPEFSEEWTRWNNQNKQTFTQLEFAAFIEDNKKDIASVEGSPTGAQMLEMAITFEANQDMRFKSAIRLQNGGVQMSFTQDDDAQTLQKMQVFDRFSLGIPVFWSGDAYQIDARLRYRVREGKLSFWFELIRADKVLESSTQTLIANIRDKTGYPFFFGQPFPKANA